jgi:hypothetical protein
MLSAAQVSTTIYQHFLVRLFLAVHFIQTSGMLGSDIPEVWIKCLAGQEANVNLEAIDVIKKAKEIKKMVEHGAAGCMLGFELIYS